MSDIVERLRDNDTARRIGESYADVHDRRQRERDEGAAEITRLTARVAQLEAALRDLVRFVDEDQHERDLLAAMADQVLDKARAALTQPAEEDTND
jgi:cell division protein FtsB